MTSFTLKTTTEEVASQLKDQIKGKNGQFLIHFSDVSNCICILQSPF
jgi:hypothetical protein